MLRIEGNDYIVKNILSITRTYKLTISPVLHYTKQQSFEIPSVQHVGNIFFTKFNLSFFIVVNLN